MPFLRIVLTALAGCLCSAALAQDETQARQLLDAGRHEDAIRAYTRLLEASPRQADWLLLRGLAHSRRQQWAQAIDDLEAAVAVAPDYLDAWQALGQAYRGNAQPDKAAFAFARLAQLRPNDPEVLAARLPTNAPAGSGLLWAASVGASHSRNALGSTQERQLSLRRQTALGPIALEQLELRRLGQQDRAWAIDAYPRLWSGAYANVRYQHAASPTLYPERAWRAELYQGLGQGWEAAVSRDHLGFAAPVEIDGVALAKYWGNVYVRWRHQRVHASGSTGQGDRLTLRYFYRGDADHFVEANISNGRSDGFGGPLVASARSDSRGLVWSHFVTRDWGLKAAWNTAQDSSSAGGRERTLNLGLTHRW